jgi:tripartite-type tricarboxylate transporter receptor subunit TctC
VYRLDNPVGALLEQKEILMLTRRKTLQLAASAVAMPFVPRAAWAQAYPNRPVKIVVSFPPGGPTDILARLIAQRLSERLAQQFLVENRPGGTGNIGVEAAARSAPDGHTLLMTDSTPAINTTLFEKLSYDLVRDFVHIGGALLSLPRSNAQSTVHF